MKNRDKAKQIETMAGYNMGMPGYKEPEEKAEEEVPLESKWVKTGKNWEKINLKPAIRHVDSKIETTKMNHLGLI